MWMHFVKHFALGVAFLTFTFNVHGAKSHNLEDKSAVENIAEMR